MADQTAKEIRIAQFSLLCGNLIWTVSGTILAGLALFVALQEQLPLGQRMAWFATILIITGIRFYFLRQWMKHPATVDNVDRRILIAIGLATLMSFCFGALAYIAVAEDNPLTTLLVVMVLTGMIASATAAISHILLMYILYIFPLMLPVAYRLFQFEQVGYHWIAGLIALYLVVCLGTSRSIRLSIMRSINVRFENLSLLENLRHEKQRAEVALAREEQANHAKSKFLAAASHDLRQPLHSLRLFTATLELQTRETKHKTLVSQIDSSVKSLEELFNALLDISKFDAGTFTVDKQHIYLDILLSQIEGEFKPLAKEKQLSFDVELQDLVVYTDALLLERLIRNLASNAIRYTETGGVTISTEANGPGVAIAVTDTGVGIPKADHERVFEEFVQLGNAERNRNQGIGLGLSIVHRLSILLGVKVNIQSNAGKGTRFIVNVPLGDPVQCRFLPRYENIGGDKVDTLFVLVIDDEEEVCQAIEGLMETWGCIVMTAISGDTALIQLDEIGEIPDVIVSDYRLRDGETGGDVIRRVREKLGLSLPAIILTGDIAPERLIDIQNLGYPMLHKPCEPEALRRLLAQSASEASPRHPTLQLETTGAQHRRS